MKLSVGDFYYEYSNTIIWNGILLIFIYIDLKNTAVRLSEDNKYIAQVNSVSK